jgi:hypothetical protein
MLVRASVAAVCEALSEAWLQAGVAVVAAERTQGEPQARIPVVVPGWFDSAEA